MTVATKTGEVTHVAEAPHRCHGLRRRDHHPGPDREPPLNGGSSPTWSRCAGRQPASTDPTKSTQYAPQAWWRRPQHNYLIDGGDNNDDTVGGLVQASR